MEGGILLLAFNSDTSVKPRLGYNGIEGILEGIWIDLRRL
jgi:hypothetical protein